MDPAALLEHLKLRTGLQERHVRCLQTLGATMQPLAQEVALAFYDYLGRDEEMQRLLWAVPGRVERLYTSFAAWYGELFSGCYDAVYAQRRYRIGLVHARLGVAPRYMIPAMGVVQELSLSHLTEVLRPLQVIEAVEAFEKIIAIEIALLEESYLAAMEQGLSLGHSESTQGALTMGAAALLQEV
ncbi:MAG: hypothetical protein KGZ60_01660 [Truepera sp.]|nr:hypothetical protein [Truepera sp.]